MKLLLIIALILLVFQSGLQADVNKKTTKNLDKRIIRYSYTDYKRTPYPHKKYVIIKPNKLYIVKPYVTN